MTPRRNRRSIGETPNLAARLQTLAEPGTVLICPQTRQLTGGHFDYGDLGAVRAQRLGRAGTGLAGARAERRGQPLRGDAQDQAAAAVRA
jgi:class 3 adenylate cyclase